MKKTILIICLLTTILFLVTACKEKDYGKVNEVDIDSSFGTEETMSDGSKPDELFKGTEENLGYEYKKVDIGEAELRLPYPSSWSVSKTTDYNICFTAPDNDPYFPGQQIYFHSTFQMEEPYDHTTVRDEFLRWIHNDQFRVQGRNVKLLSISDIEKTSVNSKIADPNYQYELSYRDWDAKTLPKTSGAYHQSTTFYWYKVPCILSGMTSNDQADNMHALLLYMMSHAEYINNYIASVEKYDLFPDTSRITTKVCPLLREQGKGFYTLDGYYNNVAQFTCPANSGTAFSQISLSFYEVKKKKWHDLKNEADFEEWFMEPLIRNALGDEAYEDAEFTGVFSKTGGKLDFNDGDLDEYMYSFTIHNYNTDEYFDGQKWVSQFFIKENGEFVDIIAVTGREDSLPWMVDVMDFTSVATYFGGNK